MSERPLSSSVVVVIGAGMAGLVAAQDLTTRGATVIVLDKGRGVGGRLATRRIGAAVLDHGAQFFTARSETFVAEVTSWVDHGAATPWFTGVLGEHGVIEPDALVRHRGAPAMTGVAKHLARGLDVRLSERVESVRWMEKRWRIGSDGGDVVDADAVVLTAPAPQTVAMLDPASIDPADTEQLERISFDPCLAVLAVLDRSPAIGAPGARRPSSEPLAWYADNQAKGVSPTPALTLHAGPETSRRLWSKADADVVSELLGAVDLSGAKVLDSQVQRWRYAQPTVWHPEPTLLLRGTGPGAVAGDAFGSGGRVEGAALSGLAAAAAVAHRLTTG